MPVDMTRNVRAVLRSLGPQGTELDALVARAKSPDYWRNLCPDMSVQDADAWSLDASTASVHALDHAAACHARFGYLTARNLLPETQVHLLRRCIETLRREKWPPIFILVYDQPWLLPQMPNVRALLRLLMPAGYMLLPQISAHYVSSSPGRAGWSPHRDSLDGTADSVTCWFPLSAATPNNGCIYLVPRGTSGSHLASRGATDTLTGAEARLLLHSVIALPAMPGDLLCWDGSILHWGGCHVEPATDSRVSMAMVFGPRPEAARASSTFSDADLPPSFERRLRFIAASVANNSGLDAELELTTTLAAALNAGAR
jgi:Phytanoyl-CoA dioxygenase (PhyH)